MLMPYGEKVEIKTISIDIYVLGAKEKYFLKVSWRLFFSKINTFT
jgi:hypothetical protein